MFSSSQFQADDGNQEVRDLQAAVQGIQRRIDELEQNRATGDLNARVNAIQTDVAQLYTRIDNGLRRLGSDFSQRLASIFRELNSLNARIDRDFNTLRNDVLRLQAEINRERQERINQYIALQAEIKRNNIAACIADIRDNNLNAAVEKFRQINDNEVINQIISQAYGNSLSNFEKVLNFSRKLPYISQLGIAYDCLFNEMRNNGHLYNPEIFMLAYKVKEAMGWSNYSQCTQETKDKCDRIKAGLPDGVRRVFWDSYIVLKSKQNGGLLDAGPGHMRHHPEEENTNGYLRWLPIPKDEGKYFVLKSKQNGGLLDAGPGHMRHHPEEENTNGYLRWQFKPKTDGSYVLKSKQNGGLLDAGPGHMRHHPEEEDTNGYLRWHIK